MIANRPQLMLTRAVLLLRCASWGLYISEEIGIAGPVYKHLES